MSCVGVNAEVASKLEAKLGENVPMSMRISQFDPKLKDGVAKVAAKLGPDQQMSVRMSVFEPIAHYLNIKGPQLKLVMKEQSIRYRWTMIIANAGFVWLRKMFSYIAQAILGF